MRAMSNQEQGVALVEKVIERVKQEGFKKVFGRPKLHVHDREPAPVDAATLEAARLEGGLALTPSMKAWLAFDGGFFGWFRGGALVAGTSLLDACEEQFGDDIAMLAPLMKRLPGKGYVLPLEDVENLHVVYASKVDSTGELPVLSFELENQRVGLIYPGVDLFLAYHAGLLDRSWRAGFADRIAEHRRANLGGKPSIELDDLEEEGEDEVEGEGEGSSAKNDLPPGVVAAGKELMLTGDGPVPDGFSVIGEATNPFTKERVRRLRRA